MCAAVLFAGCTAAPEPDREVSTPNPGEFEPPLHTPDLLVTSREPVPKAQREEIDDLAAVSHTAHFTMAGFFVEEQQVSYAAVDPATFRNFMPAGTAQSDAIWQTVAAGGLILRPGLDELLGDEVGSTVTIGSGDVASDIPVGGSAPLAPEVFRPWLDAVVNEAWATDLDLPVGNALLVSTGTAAPQEVRGQIAEIVGPDVAVQILGPDLDVGSVQTAVLTGGSLAAAVGSFTYTVNRDGTVNPDPRWVRDFIRTEQVPILGAVKCNKAMLPQLRAALTEVVARGLAAEIHPGEYGGCYVPRFIERNPARGLSFHTWGTAIDLNVPGNQRGTRGEISRQVVEIFQKWGFNWGGTWRWTDPMHFELARLVKAQ